MAKSIIFHKPHRLRGYDYSSEASYLLTFNTAQRKRILSEILPGENGRLPTVKLYPFGIIVEKYILQIESHYPGITLENYVIMPDHVHLLLTVEYKDLKNKKPVIPAVIQAVKSLTTKEISENIWQLDYYDVIAQTEEIFLKLDAYVDNNPAAWLDNNEKEPPTPK